MIGAYNVFANVTKTVVVLISVRRGINVVNVVSAVRSVPVIGFVLRPFGSILVSMIVVPGTYVADTVVVFVKVESLILLYVVVTGRIVPVIGFIVSPVGRVGVSVIVVPAALVTDTVSIIILVDTQVSVRDAVTAGNVAPVLVVVVRPGGFVGMSMIVIVLADVADGIVVRINVSRLIHNGYIVCTSYLVPVVVFVVGPIKIVFVLVIVIPFTNRNVTDTVVVFVGVLTGKSFAASVTNEVKVNVLVVSTFKSFLTSIAPEVFIVVYVVYTRWRLGRRT